MSGQVSHVDLRVTWDDFKNEMKRQLGSAGHRGVKADSSTSGPMYHLEVEHLLRFAYHD